MANAGSVGEPILKYSLQGELLEEFPTVRAAARAIGVNSSNIIRAAQGVDTNKRRYVQVKGFLWRYKKSPLEQQPALEKQASGKKPKPVFLTKEQEILAFPSMAAAGRYLVEENQIESFHSVGICFRRGCRVAGWTVSLYEEAPVE